MLPLGRLHERRPAAHLVRVFELAAAARALLEPDRAVSRMTEFLAGLPDVAGLADLVGPADAAGSPDVAGSADLTTAADLAQRARM